MSKIIYPIEDGKIAVIHQTPKSELSIEELARKDVPEGKPYVIVKDSDIPEDRTFRGAWEADFSKPDGVGIGHEAWEAERAKATEDKA